MWIHLLATIFVVSAGFYFHVQTTEWLFLIIAILGVWITEALNTSIEFLCNRVNSEKDSMIGHAKDLAAASVLIAAIGAVMIGVIIFFPYFNLLNRELP